MPVLCIHGCLYTTMQIECVYQVLFFVPVASYMYTCIPFLPVVVTGTCTC